MASVGNLHQPLISPFTSDDSPHGKDIESSPSTMIAMTTNPTSFKEKKVSNSKRRVRQRLMRRQNSSEDIFMVNMSHRLALRKKLHNRLSFLTDIMCFLSLVGIVLMIIENEITFVQINHRDTILSWSIKLIITITTIILVGLVLFYHSLDLILSSVNNSTDDWRVGFTNKKIFLIVVEVIICAIHPVVRSFPHHSNNIAENPSLNSTTPTSYSLSYIPIDVALGLPMFARLYLFCRFIIYHSHLVRDAASQSLGYLNQVSINFSFLLKTYLDQWPIHCLLIFCGLIFFIGSWCLRACNYNATNAHLPILDAMWLFIVTYTTVGYGDLTTSTYCGRSIASLIALIGLLSSALVIAVLAQKLMLGRWEKYVHNFVLNVELAKEHKVQAANVVKYAVKLWYWKRKKSSSSTQYLQMKRKLFRSINIIQQIKKEQRGFVDNCIGLPEIVTMQRSTNTNTDDTIKKIEKLGFKIDNMEQQFINVKHTIDSIQNTLNLLMDSITK